MTEQAVEFIVGTFQDENSAHPAMEQLKAARKSRQINLMGAVLVRKGADGAVEYQDVGLTPAKGAVGGIVLGAAVGILTGGLGLVLGTLGGLVGGLMGRKRSGSQYTNDQIYHLLVALPPGSSAILAVTAPEAAGAVESELLALGAEVIRAEIPAELAAQLHARGDQA
jgi:uncharacterized membrane protein